MLLLRLVRLARRIRARQSIGLFGVATLLSLAVIGNAVCFYTFERAADPSIRWGDAFWYSAISITTIGYGDFSASTLGARLGTVLFVVVVGLTSFSLFFSIVLDAVTGAVLNAQKGLGRAMVKDHILIVHFPSAQRVTQLIDEIRCDPEHGKCEIVIVSDAILELPFVMRDVIFVRGSSHDVETYTRARAKDCRMAVVLSPDYANPDSDAIVAAAVRVIDRVKSEIHIVAECLDERHRPLFDAVHCDAIVLGMTIAGNLLIQEVHDPGIAQLVETISSNRRGTTLFSVVVRDADVPYLELAQALLGRSINLMAVNRGLETKTLLDGIRSQVGDRLIYSARERLEWRELCQGLKSRELEAVGAPKQLRPFGGVDDEGRGSEHAGLDRGARLGEQRVLDRLLVGGGDEGGAVEALLVADPRDLPGVRDVAILAPVRAKQRVDQAPALGALVGSGRERDAQRQDRAHREPARERVGRARGRGLAREVAGRVHALGLALLKQRHVGGPDLLEHRPEQHRMPARVVAEQGLGAGAAEVGEGARVVEVDVDLRAQLIPRLAKLGRRDRSLAAAELADPRLDHLQAIDAPVELRPRVRVDDAGWDPEHPGLDRLVGARAQLLLDRRLAEPGQDRVGVEALGVEDRAQAHLGREIDPLDPVGAEHRVGQLHVGRPDHEQRPQGLDRADRVTLGHAQRHPGARGLAVHVGEVVPGLRRRQGLRQVLRRRAGSKHAAEQHRPRVEARPRPLGEHLDARRRDVGVGAREVEVKPQRGRRHRREHSFPRLPRPTSMIFFTPRATTRRPVYAGHAGVRLGLSRWMHGQGRGPIWPVWALGRPELAFYPGFDMNWDPRCRWCLVRAVEDFGVPRTPTRRAKKHAQAQASRTRSPMDSAVNSDDTPDQDALYRHTKRSQWGVAVFLWERDGKRAFRFADGETRVFKKGFYKLMVPAPAPEDGSAEELRAKVRASMSGKKEEIIPTVGDQLILLLQDYPQGFEGDAWRDKHRGSGRRLKRHRDPAVKQAREVLAADRIAGLHEHGDYAGVLGALTEVLTETDLVPSAHIAKLKKTKPTQEFSATILEIVKDPAEATVRQLQAGLVGAQGPATSWQILTAPLALLAPHKHMCVRPSVFAVQGRIVMPRFTAPKRASEASYQRFMEVAQLVEDELRALGHPPTDLLDLHDFVWMTLRPAAREELNRIHLQNKDKASEASSSAPTV